MRGAIAAAIVSVCCILTPIDASAEPRLPKPHHRETTVMKQWLSGGSKVNGAELRAVGTYSMSKKWAIEYDLRAGELTASHHGETHTVTGFGDQLVGIEHALHQHRRFADAVALNVLVPTGSTSSGRSAGVVAVQPGYELEVRGNGSHAPYASVGVGLRLYSGGFGGQWRSYAEVGTNVGRTFSVAALLENYHSLNANAHGPAGLNELRLGLELKERVSAKISPFIRYERDFTARNHATRISFGVDLKQ